MIRSTANATALRLGDDRGQGLVEYALILALVGLAAIVALGFLSGKINSLFSKAGNSLNNVPVAVGGVGTGGTGGGPPLPTTPVEVDDNPITWFSLGSQVNGGPDNYQGLTGVYTESGGGPVGTACSFLLPGGATWTGVWINEETGPGDGEWNVTGDGESDIYEWACLNVTAPLVPQPGSITIGPPPAPSDQTPDDGDFLRATGDVISPAPSEYEFQWQRADANGLADCSTVVDGAYADLDSDDSNTNFDDVQTTNFDNNGTSNRCYRVHYRGENSNGDGPWSAWSPAFWVEDD